MLMSQCRLLASSSIMLVGAGAVSVVFSFCIKEPGAGVVYLRLLNSGDGPRQISSLNEFTLAEALKCGPGCIFSRSFFNARKSGCAYASLGPGLFSDQILGAMIDAKAVPDPRKMTYRQ